jgi:hypothetical protein
MFDWFKDKNQNNVVHFPNKGLPEPKEYPPMPETPTENHKVYYRFGVTDSNRVAFQMGYSEITMNREGCQNLIDQLTFFMNQLKDDNTDE